MSYATGLPALDMFGSRFGSIYGLTIVGDETNRPAVGIALGRDATGLPCSGQFLTGVAIRGWFSIACLYNYAAETSVFNHLDLKNADTGQASYALAQDGTYRLAVPSAFVAMPSGESAQSFNENLFLGLVARKDVSGPTIYIRRCSRHRYEDGYAVSNDDSAIVMDSDGFGSDGIYLDVHCETSDTTDPATGIKTCVWFQGTASTQEHRSFTFIDHSPHCNQQVFGFDTAGSDGLPITLCKFRSAVARIGTWNYTNGITPVNGVFGQRTVVDWQGSIYIGRQSQFMQNLGRSVMALEIQDRDLATYGVGTQSITCEDQNYRSIKGGYRFYQDETTSGVAAGALNSQGSTGITGTRGVSYYINNSAGNEVEFFRLDSAAIDNTAGAESGELLLRGYDSGAAALASISVGAGFPTHTPTTTAGLYIRLGGGPTTTLYVWDGAVWTGK